MTKSLALDPHDLSSRGDLLPSRAGIPPRVASIIWNRNFPSLLSDPSTVVLRYNATFSQEEHLFGHSELSFAALMLWLGAIMGAIRCSSRLPIQRRRLFGAEIKS